MSKVKGGGYQPKPHYGQINPPKAGTGAVNQKLGDVSCWVGERCARCGRSTYETELNIEGVIHHGSRLECLDRKSCQRYIRRHKEGDLG